MSLFRKLFRSLRPSAPSFRPAVEALDGRIVPSTVDQLILGLAPDPSGAAAALDNLFFPTPTRPAHHRRDIPTFMQIKPHHTRGHHVPHHDAIRRALELLNEGGAYPVPFLPPTPVLTPIPTIAPTYTPVSDAGGGTLRIGYLDE